jgi:predicted Zn-dependent protease
MLNNHANADAHHRAIIFLINASKLPVILGPGWPGVLLHEAIGHGLEGDFNRKGTSVFTGKIGEQVASEKCTIVDNGTLANRRGSLTVDDEGTQTSLATMEIFFSASSPEPMRVAPLTGWLILPFLIS